jgi:hypothetical protein
MGVFAGSGTGVTINNKLTQVQRQAGIKPGVAASSQPRPPSYEAPKVDDREEDLSVTAVCGTAVFFFRVVLQPDLTLYAAALVLLFSRLAHAILVHLFIHSFPPRAVPCRNLRWTNSSHLPNLRPRHPRRPWPATAPAPAPAPAPAAAVYSVNLRAS